MKGKAWVVLSLVLMVAVLVGLVPGATPSMAAVLEWTPDNPDTTGNVIGPAGIDIVDLAVAADNQTAYAVTGATAGIGIYKTVDAGSTWSKLDNPAGVGTAITKVAVARGVPDGSSVGIIADSNEVYLSTDSGFTWTSLGSPGASTSLNAIDISLTGSILVGGSTIAGVGVWYRDTGGVAPWTNAAVTDPGTGWNASSFGTATSVWDVAFSPNFAIDRTFLAVTDDGARTSLQIASFSEKRWNDSDEFSEWGTGVEVVASGPVSSASLALSGDFLSTDPSHRVAYVGVAGATGSGLFRTSNTTVTALKTEVKINSVALNSAGNTLLAGCFDTNDVWVVSHPGSVNPPVGEAHLNKRPGLDTGGNERVVVAWAGTRAVAGTSGPESAISISSDGGFDFNDVSLVDTTYSPVDSTLSSDGSTIFVASFANGNLSVWRKTSTWERVLTRTITSGATDFLIRCAPPDISDPVDVPVYVCERNTAGFSMVLGSPYTGDAKWLSYGSSPPGILDLAVESFSVLYALTDSGAVSKFSDGWNTPRTLSFTPFSIVSLSPNNLLVGGAGGQVAYSTDGNDSWISDLPPIPGGGNVSVTATGLASGDFIYATSNCADNVYRWKLGLSTGWTSMRSSPINNATGIALAGGALYVLATADGGSSLYRTAAPATATSDSGWVEALAPGKVFGDSPQPLSVTGNDTLWAINQTANTLESYTDVFTKPTVITGNGDNATPTSGRLHGSLNSLGTASLANVTFQWGTGSGNYTEETPAQTLNAAGPFYADVTGLSANTTYYFRAVAYGDGIAYGAETAFNTTGVTGVLTLTSTVEPAEVPSPSSNQSVPLQDIPLQDIPLQDIPLQDMPLQDIGLGSTPLQDIPLQDIPLQHTSWAQLLAGTSLADTPLQDITLKDLFLAGIPLQDISLADILLATLPLQDINVNGTPLQDIVLAGTPLQDIPLQDISLNATMITGTPLQDIPLQDIGGIDWSARLTDTSLNATPLQDITLGDLVGYPSTLEGISLRDALLALIPLQDIPWESIPLQDIPLSSLFSSQNTVTYTDSVTNSSSGTAESVRLTHTLPAGFIYVAGSTSGDSEIDPVIEGQQLTWGPVGMDSGATLQLSFNAAAPISLGSYSSNVTAASLNLGETSITGAAAVIVTDTFEPNDSIDQSVEIAKDRLYMSYISSATDRDFYRIPVPEKGSMVKVYLSHLPADYDLTMLSAVTPASVPLQDIPLQDIPLQDIPLQDIPLQDIPLQDIPLQDIPLQDIPLQDIPLQDIPLQDISTHRGATDEIVSSNVVNQTGDYYIMISGYNGAFSDLPYMLRVEITPPLPIVQASRTIPGPDPNAKGAIFEYNSSDLTQTQTIILDNKQRLTQYYSSADVTALRAKLEAFASRADVKGMILPVEADTNVAAAYAAWDGNVADPAAANAVAEAIRAVLMDAISVRPNVKYVVVVGSDEIIPFFRVPDDTYVSNESNYAAQAHLQKPSALEAALSHGNILTDDYYVDMAPVPWNGRELYVPDYSIGRLVETPAEIMGILDQYTASNGQLMVNAAVVTGYDFLTDAAQAIVNSLESKGISASNITTLIGQTWTNTDLANALVSANATSPDLVSLNAHFNHWASGPPVGSPFYSTQVLAGQLQGTLIYSLGCHSGLNVSDNVTLSADPSKPGDWTLDMPQAFAEQGAWYIGNTGYGYGDDTAVALSEELMLRFTDALSTPSSTSVPVGQALVNAKQGYFLNMGSYGPFDEKVMIESTLYGLPMYRIDPSSLAAPAAAADPDLTITINQVSAEGSPLGTLTHEASLTLNSTVNGDFYAADGQTAYVPYRPIQPQTSLNIQVPGQVAHGALLTGATYQDTASFNPVVARPTWDQAAYEPQFINEAWYPAKLQSVMSLKTPSGLQQALVVTPGQFITTSADPQVKGTGRLYTALDYTVFYLPYSPLADYSPPIISQVTMDALGNLSVTATDTGNVNRVVVAWTAASGGTAWTSFDLILSAGKWIGKLPGGTISDFIVQAIDDAGNVGMSALKGLYNTLNYPPVAVDHLYKTDNGILNISSSSGVLSNATDIDGDGLTALLVGPPENGSLNLNANGSFTYTANSGFYGADNFTYQVSDGKLDSNTATVEIRVYTNHPPTDITLTNNSIPENQPEGTVVGVFDAVDADNGDTFTYNLVGGNADNAFFMIDGNTLKTTAVFKNMTQSLYSIEVKTVDAGYLSCEKPFSISVTPNNKPPTAQSQSLTTHENTVLPIILSATDPDGDVLSYSIVKPPGHGTLSGTLPKITYNPVNNYYGPDSFTFKTNDGQVDSNSATVTIAIEVVRHAPVAADQSATTKEDTPVVIRLEATDADGDSLSYEVVGGPAHGKLGGVGPLLIYTPADDYNGLDFFTFKANDGRLDSNIATVNVVVGAPFANDDGYIVNKNGSLNVPNPGILANDTHAKDVSPAAVLVKTVNHGTLLLNANGSFTYKPNAGYSGVDNFIYQINDGTLNSAAAVVIISVLDPAKKNSAITLTPLINFSAFHQAVTFTARVSSPKGVPTGTVTFEDGATILGTANLDRTGKATFTTSALEVGKHSIIAIYGGNGSFNCCSSYSVLERIFKAPTSIKLSSSRNPSSPGNSVVYTASVSTSTGTPGGSVLVLDGFKIIGTVPLNGKKATVTEQGLSKGLHIITAIYVGDDNYAMNLGVLIQRVN